jgi:hypothetical protein
MTAFRNVARLLVLPCAFSARLAAAPLDAARVDVPFPEFRTLLEESSVKKSSLASAILSARYEVGFGEGFLSGTAAFDVQTFRDGTHSVSLLSDKAIIESVEPADAVLVRSGNSHALVVEGRRRGHASLRFHLPVEAGGANPSVDLEIMPAALASLKPVNVPASSRFLLRGGYLRGDTWYLGGARTIRMELAAADGAKPPALALPAIVGSSTANMRVVRDGALYNAMKWDVRHRSAVDFQIVMPPDVQFVAFTIDGRPAQPSRIDGRNLEIRLPEVKSDAAGSLVEFSYTAHKPAFAPVRGELALELPATPLLVEKSEWLLALPAGFEPIAVDGNVECLPAKEPGLVRLSKEITTGEAPALRLFYEKSEPAKKP